MKIQGYSDKSVEELHQLQEENQKLKEENATLKENVQILQGKIEEKL